MALYGFQVRLKIVALKYPNAKLLTRLMIKLSQKSTGNNSLRINPRHPAAITVKPNNLFGLNIVALSSKLVGASGCHARPESRKEEKAIITIVPEKARVVNRAYSGPWPSSRLSTFATPYSNASR